MNLELITKDLSEETAVQVKNSVQEFIIKANEWREQIDSLVIESVNDTAKMKIAREARLFLKNNRLEAKRLVDQKRDEVKAKKLQFDLEDRAWLKGFQLVEEVCKSLEDKAREKEEYAERIEAERKEKLREERWVQLSQFVEVEPYGLGDMPESTFNALFTGAKQHYEEKIEAERKSEQERIERERKEKLYNERRHQTSRLVDFIDNYEETQWHELSEDDFESIVQSGIAKRNEYEKKQAQIKQENEQLKKQAEEAEKRRKKLEEERLKLQKEKESELARIQAELDIERKKEELRIQREKEAEEAKKRAEKEALLAPDKEKILNYVKTINPNIPDLSSTRSKEVLNEINEKLESWKNWAQKTINEKL